MALLREDSSARILRFLWKSRTEWSGREISRQVRLSAPSCHQALKKLYAQGLVLFRRVSNVHLYKINQENYMVQSLAQLFEAEAAMPDQVQSLIKKCLGAGAESDVLSLTIFGSTARGTSRPGSDLDLLVVIRAKERLGDMESRIEKLRSLLFQRFSIPLSPYVQTLSELRRKHRQKLPLIKGILKDGQRIYGDEIRNLLT